MSVVRRLISQLFVDVALRLCFPPMVVFSGGRQSSVLREFLPDVLWSEVLRGHVVFVEVDYSGKVVCVPVSLFHHSADISGVPFAPVMVLMHLVPWEFSLGGVFPDGCAEHRCFCISGQ